MRWSTACAVLVVAGVSETVRAESPSGGSDLATEVQAIFARKCAGCHGPDLPSPKGRFGYVLDLRRIAGNPEMVIPDRPEESELWLLVSRGEMPPTDSPRGPLGAAEKETVRAWIAAGAPEPRAAPRTVTPVSEPVAGPDLASADRFVRFLGKLHLLLLHFPIALVLAAGVGELLAARRGSREPSASVGFCLALAAAAVVPTVALGWLHAASGHGVASPQLLSAHRWLGTLTGAWLLVAALWFRRDRRRGARSRGGRLALVAAGLFVTATAHAGGLLAHGRDFFAW